MERTQFQSQVDGYKIVYDKFVQAHAQATFVIVHGKHGYSDRYHEFAHYLLSKGFNSYIMNHRGHGHTGALNKDFGYFEGNSKKTFISDLNYMINIAKMENLGGKIILLGHSMGSYITRCYIAQYQDIDAYICIGTTNPSPLILNLILVISWLLTTFNGKKNGIFLAKLLSKHSADRYKHLPPNSWLTHDEKIRLEFTNSKLSQYEFKNKTFYDFVWFLRKGTLKSSIKKISNQLPILLMVGNEDISSKNGKLVGTFYVKLKKLNKDVHLKRYDKMRHEILQELDRTKVFNDIIEFVNHKVIQS